jgi:hypothetical protein
MKNTALWGMTPCSLLEDCWNFRGTYCLYLQCQGMTRQHAGVDPDP